MPRAKRKIDWDERAAFFQVCTRTVRRWHDEGVNVFDLEAIATHLLAQKNPAPEALKTIIRKLP